MTAKRTDINIDDLIKMYLNGSSEKQLSERFNIARGGIRSRLIAAGITPRGRSEANRIKMSKMTPRQRRDNARAAHVARSIKGDTPETVKIRTERRSISNQFKTWQIGRDDKIVINALKKRGVDPIPQYPIGGYNIDIAIAPVAVEVYRSVNNPLADKRNRKRTINLLNAGWSVVYIWFAKESDQLSKNAIDHVIALFEAMRRKEPAPRQYWVIRSNGEPVSSGGGYLDNFSAIFPHGGSLYKSNR